jgi:hypothetical protein
LIEPLMVTQSAERVSNMLSAIDKITGGKGSNFFLLIDQTKLAGADPCKSNGPVGSELS